MLATGAAALLLALVWLGTRVGVAGALRTQATEELQTLLAVELAVARLAADEASVGKALAEALRLGRYGNSGEAYLFDAAGRAASALRFAEAAQRAGGGEPLPLHDPGGDLEEGYRPDLPWASLPPTRLVEAALAARTAGSPSQGMVEGSYRNYAGREAFGAWGWIEGRELAIAVEVGADEALAPVRYVDLAFGTAASTMLIAWLIYTGGTGGGGRVGPYRLGRRIGEGAMSNVYLAHHEMLGRTCAVKVLKLQAQSDELLKRFEREAKLAGQLAHPNIVEIYDYGLAPGGALYYAMEYVDGLTLAQMVENHGPVHPARAVRFLRQVCSAIAEMHAKAMLHRDIKPENVMAFARDGRYDLIKLLDFGLVKSVAGGETRDLTRFVQVLGTPAWMAPERLSDPRNVDSRSDLYSIGALGFFLLAGRRPFESSAEQDLVQQVLHLEAPAVSKCSPHAVPPALDGLIARCLAKDPGQRPESAAEILDELDAIAADCPWRGELARLWWAGMARRD